MTTRLQITVDTGGLLDKDALQRYASRSAAAVQNAGEKAVKEGEEQRAADRARQGLDVETGREPNTASKYSSSKLKAYIPDPAANRILDRFYVGVAWFELLDHGESGIDGVFRIGCGDASKWLEIALVPVVSSSDIIPDVTISEYEQAMEALPKPPWDNFNEPLIAPTDYIGGSGPFQWSLAAAEPIVDGELIGQSAYWQATPNEVVLGGASSIREVKVLPAGKDAAYVIFVNEESAYYSWSKGLYHGYRYFDFAANNVLWYDYFTAVEADSYSYHARQVSTFYVTRTNVAQVETPTWAAELYSYRTCGTLQIANNVSGSAIRRSPNPWYYAITRTYPMPPGTLPVNYPPAGTWMTAEPSTPYSYQQYSFSSPLDLASIDLPLNPNFPNFPETDDDSFPGGDLVYLQPYGGGIFTPFQFFIGDNNFINDASTDELKRAYGMVTYLYQADTKNYAGDSGDTVINAFALDPTLGRSAQQVFDDAISARYLAFKNTENKRSSSSFAPVGSATINGLYASPLYFSDWERPDFCSSKLQALGFTSTPLT